MEQPITIEEVNKPMIYMKVSDIKIYILPKALLKIYYYTQYAPNEVGGLLVVNKINNDIFVEDALMFKQRASGGDFELDDDELAKFIDDTATKNPELLPKIKGWFHSHVNMDAFWSGTDNKQFEVMRAFTNDFTIGVVTNKRGDYKWRVDVKTDFNPIVLDNLPFRIHPGTDALLEKECRETVKTKVKTGWPNFDFTKRLFSKPNADIKDKKEVQSEIDALKKTNK